MKYFRINHWKKKSQIECIVFIDAPFYNNRNGEIILSKTTHKFINVSLEKFIHAIWLNELSMDIVINKENYVHNS